MHSGERLLLGGGAHDLRDRQVGGALAVRRAASDEHLRLVVDDRQKLACEPRLADTRLSDDRDDVAVLFVACACIRGSEAVELVPAADERRIEAARVRRRGWKDLLYSPRFVDGLGREPRRARAGASLRSAGSHRRRALFEPRRDAPGRSRQVQVFARFGEHVHLSRADADAGGKLDVPVLAAERLLSLGGPRERRGAHRPRASQGSRTRPSPRRR